MVGSGVVDASFEMWLVSFRGDWLILEVDGSFCKWVVLVLLAWF